MTSIRHHAIAAARPTIDAVCRWMGVSVSDFLGKGRHPRVVAARMIVVGLLREIGGGGKLSYPDIAAALGRRTHSAAWDMDRRWKALDERLRDEARRIARRT